MSRDWAPEELDAVSRYMAAQGLPTYEEFCKALTESVTISPESAENNASSPQERL